MKRKYPLFITDLSRSHGREVETDYISCTSKELPFVAEVTFITEYQYQKEYDRENVMVIYDTGHNKCRIRMEVVDIRDDFDPAQLRSLLNRAMKEYITRRSVTLPSNANVSLFNKLTFLEELLKQGYQQKRREPDNHIVTESLNILESIKKDYEDGYSSTDRSADC